MLAVRLVGMFVVLILLLASIATANDFYDIVLPLQCSYANIASIKNTNDASAFGFRNDILPGGWAAAWVIVYLGISSYGRMLQLLSYVAVRLSFSPKVFNAAEKIGKKIWKNKRQDPSYRPKIFRYSAIQTPDKNRRHRLAERFVVVREITIRYGLFQDLMNSFMGELILATFGFCYGLMQVAVNIWLLPQLYRKPILQGQNSAETALNISHGPMAFSQLMPPLLLILPFLAALEAYEGAFDGIILQETSTD